MGQSVREFLEEEAYTTDEERDPTKPFILKDDMVSVNPNYDPSLVPGPQVQRKLGTSFFLNFDPRCSKIYQEYGRKEERARSQIVEELYLRFIEVFTEQFPDNPPPRGSLEQHLVVSLDERGVTGFNYGEIYFWLREVPLKEEVVIQILLAFKKNLIENPITVFIDGEDFEISFYGWGFRYV